MSLRHHPSPLPTFTSTVASEEISSVPVLRKVKVKEISEIGPKSKFVKGDLRSILV